MILLILKLSMSYFSFIPFAISITYNVDNASDVFEYFKEKYNKGYKNATEERIRLETFVFNLNKVEHLNAIAEDKDTFYIINQYGDSDTKELRQHYAINIKPCKCCLFANNYYKIV